MTSTSVVVNPCLRVSRMASSSKPAATGLRGAAWAEETGVNQLAVLTAVSYHACGVSDPLGLQGSDVRDDILHGLFIGQRRRHRAHLLTGGTGRGQPRTPL